MEEVSLGYFKVDKDKDIYVIGDIHGDYEVFTHVLVDLTKACSNKNNYIKWIEGNKSIIVFCGDVIHRKRFLDHVLDDESSDIKIIETIFRLQDEAKNNGGQVVFIAGNHEIMTLINPSDMSYTSELNMQKNKDFFSDPDKKSEFVKRTYAWVRINDTMIAHGGLCSDYLGTIERYKEILKKYDKSEDTITCVNTLYKKYFISKEKESEIQSIGYSLFVDYDSDNTFKHNMFWCRQWGYDDIKCDELQAILSSIDCKKMIIAHCPQFMSPKKPKTINFGCPNKDGTFNLARIDLGMSRCFDYNLEDKFMSYLSTNHLRKMQVLKIKSTGDEISMSPDYIITSDLSAIQYVLLKYGIKLEDWKKKGVHSDWIGFEYIKKYINTSYSTKYVQNEEGVINKGSKIIRKLLEPIKRDMKLPSISKN